MRQGGWLQSMILEFLGNTTGAPLRTTMNPMPDHAPLRQLCRLLAETAAFMPGLLPGRLWPAAPG
jgi:hypothetical protein